MFHNKSNNKNNNNKEKYEKKKMDIVSYIFFLQSRRDYSYKEIYDKLILREEDPEEIKAKLTWFIEQGFQSDERMALNYYLNRRRQKGKYIISMELKRKGITEEIIRKIIEENSDEDEDLENAFNIISKFSNYDLKNPKVKNKIINKLAQKGFSFNIASKAFERLKKN